MKVLITGSRDWPYADKNIIRQAIIASGATIIIEGNARGADAQARAIAEERGLEVRTYPAFWKADGKAAGSMRNQRMLDQEAKKGDGPVDLVLAFPLETSVGTWDMVERAEAAGIEVRGFGPWY